MKNILYLGQFELLSYIRSNISGLRIYVKFNYNICRLHPSFEKFLPTEKPLNNIFSNLCLHYSLKTQLKDNNILHTGSRYKLAIKYCYMIEDKEINLFCSDILIYVL